MTLYLYSRRSGQPLEAVENVTDWNADEIRTQGAVRRGFDEDVGFSLAQEPLADAREAIRRRDDAQAALNETDYVTIQWQSELALGIDHHRTQEAYQAIEAQRQLHRETIRQVNDALGLTSRP